MLVYLRDGSAQTIILRADEEEEERKRRGGSAEGREAARQATLPIRMMSIIGSSLAGGMDDDVRC